MAYRGTTPVHLIGYPPTKVKADRNTKVEAKISSFENFEHYPGGGDVKIPKHRTANFKDTSSKVDSFGNWEHKPAGCASRLPHHVRSSNAHFHPPLRSSGFPSESTLRARRRRVKLPYLAMNRVDSDERVTWIGFGDTKTNQKRTPVHKLQSSDYYSPSISSELNDNSDDDDDNDVMRKKTIMWNEAKYRAMIRHRKRVNRAWNSENRFENPSYHQRHLQPRHKRHFNKANVIKKGSRFEDPRPIGFDSITSTSLPPLVSPVTTINDDSSQTSLTGTFVQRTHRVHPGRRCCVVNESLRWESQAMDRPLKKLRYRRGLPRESTTPIHRYNNNDM